ncbi:hypothetical protein BKA93DRAFT_577605 [Sparassis latifolia]
MAPKNKGVACLFHPKKKKPGAPAPAPSKPETPAAGSSTDSSTSTSTPTPTPTSTPGSTSAPSKARTPRPRRPKDDDDDERPPPPQGPFVEYKLMSSARNGWKYDVMKFDSRKAVDITTWAPPVKLNRKDPHRSDGEATGAAVPQAVGPMLGPDGKPVIGADGKLVMVDAEGRPIRPGEVRADDGKDKGKDKAPPPKKRFQKKTRQVFPVPEEVRQLRKEERYPWVMEDSEQLEIWTGRMEEVAKAQTHGMFMPAQTAIFKFVPAHRWYKFQKKPNFYVMGLEEAELKQKEILKNGEPMRWLSRKRGGQPSESTMATFKSESAGSLAASGSLVYTAGQSFGPGGRRLKTVDSGTADLFGDDDDDEEGPSRKRKTKRELGAEGDVDELDFEEDFADDEEKIEPEADDEEAKEMEERLKRQYKNANKQREGYIDESDDDEEEESKLTGAGKTLQKTLRKLEKDGGYDDSDDERNPYASSEEEEEEEPPVTQVGPAIIPPEPKVRPSSSQPAAVAPPLTNGTKTPSASQPLPQTKAELQSPSRATSPVPSHGGHSVVAMRATSPKVPKPKPSPSPRIGGPTSPTASRATSPIMGAGTGSRAGSPVAQSPTMTTGIPPKHSKRKATEEPTSPTGASGQGAPPRPKKRKAEVAAPDGAAADGVLEDRMVIEWLKNTPNATTRDCIHHFRSYLTDEGKKTRFTALVKEVAQLSKGVLVLRPAYRGGGAPSPPPVASPVAG